MRSYCKLSLSLLFVIFSFWGCNRFTSTNEEDGDTIIILDPFSCADEDGCSLVAEVDSLITAEIIKKFQKKRNSQERILIYWGASEQDEHVITLPDSLRKLSNFAKFDRMFERFAASCSAAINNKICEYPDDQSAFFGVFGNRYLLKNYKAKIGKIIFAGNLMEKHFDNLTLKTDELHEFNATQQVDAKIEERFEQFRKKFDKTFSVHQEKPAGKKTNIELYISRRKLERLVYFELSHYKTYVRLVIEFLQDYDRDKEIVILNEF